MIAEVTHSISYNKETRLHNGQIYMKESSGSIVMVSSTGNYDSKYNLVCLSEDVGNSWNGSKTSEEMKKEIEREGFILIHNCKINITN
mgnify:CR=1 FL=1